MNTLVVSTYPPMACGIGKYAQQQVDALRREGHRVDVLSPEGADGDFRANLLGQWRPLRLLRYVWAYDEVIIHYTPQFFYESESLASRIKTSLAFMAVMALAGRRVTFLIHETGFKVGQSGRGRLRHRLDRWFWRRARRVIFHSSVERDLFAWYYRLNPARPQFEIQAHERYMVRRCELTQAQARAQLGLRPDKTLLLCIGFIQPHKGFDRAIRALRQVKDDSLALRIVGSVRIAWDVAHNYAQSLHDMIGEDTRVDVLEGYLSDELFDTWIAAADYVVIPYHEIWTSGVAARAKLYGRPVVVARAGGLAEQMTDGSFIFSTDEELAEVFGEISRRVAGHGSRLTGENVAPVEAGAQV